LTDRATRLFHVGAALARAMPEPVVDVAVRAAGAGAARLNPERRNQVERNLHRVYGSSLDRSALRRAVRQTFQSYARYWAESFRLPGTSAAELDARMEVETMAKLDAAVQGGKGAILALPHLGGWEWAGFWLAEVYKHPISVVVESLEPREVFEWFKELREQLGMHVIELGPDAGGEVIRALKANHVVCLLSDRAIGGGGVEVEFLGERTMLPAGPATLALRTGAPLLPTAIYYRGRMHQGVLRDPVGVEREGRLRDDVTRVTQAMAYELEALIRAAPEQWHLMQPNWPSDPGYGEARNEEQL
jgi:KDO2-lipid IV(A) lauroyltransferase